MSSMSDNWLSDIKACRRARRFRPFYVAVSAAVGYHCGDDSRRPCRLGTAPRPRLGPPGQVVSGVFGGRGAVFRRRGPLGARFRREIRPALRRRLAPPPGPEKRRRGGGEPAQPARGRIGAAGRGRPRKTRPGARAGRTRIRRVPRPRRSQRLFPPRAARRRRGRPAVAARPGEGGGARRGAEGGVRAQPAGPARRGRGRRSGGRAARRRRAARPFLRRRRAGQKPELADPGAAARRRVFASVERGAAGAPGRGGLGQACGAELRPRGARRPRPGPGPVAPRRAAHGRKPETARQGEGEGAASIARRRRDCRRGADPDLERSRPPAAVRAPRRAWRRARAHRAENLPPLRALSAMARRPSPEPDFDRELFDLPPELRWREWKARVEAVLFAAPKPVTREVLARVVGRDCALDLLLDDLREDLRGPPIELVRAGKSFTLHTRPAFGPALRVAFDIGRREAAHKTRGGGLDGGGVFPAGHQGGDFGDVRARDFPRPDRRAARGGPDRRGAAQPKARRALRLRDDSWPTLWVGFPIPLARKPAH